MCRVGEPAPGHMIIEESKGILAYRGMDNYRGNSLQGQWAGPWQKTVRRARCKGTNTNAVRHIKGGHGNCGINGTFKPEKTMDYPTAYLVLTKMYGNVYVGDKGVRAEYGELIGIFDGVYSGNLTGIAERYGIPILDRNSAVDLTPFIPEVKPRFPHPKFKKAKGS